MSTPSAEVIPLFNSSAYVSYTDEINSGKVSDSDAGHSETAFVDEKSNEIIVLNGDHRIEVRRIIESFSFPHTHVREWFVSMEREWASSWSQKSNLKCWALERGIE